MLQKESEKELLEEKYLGDLKGMNQKIVLLQYEQNMHLGEEKVKMDQGIITSTEKYTNMIETLNQRILGLESELLEQKNGFQKIFAKEKVIQENTKNIIEIEHQAAIGLLNDTLLGKIKSVYHANELELKSELQIIEDRFHSQIKLLIDTHEKSMLDLKSYFNELTQNQIILIEGLKEQLADSKQNEDHFKRQLQLVTSENKNLKKPLEQFKSENEQLSKDLTFIKRQMQSIKIDQAKSFQLNEENKRVIQENTVLKSNLYTIKSEWDSTKNEYNKKLAHLFNK